MQGRNDPTDYFQEIIDDVRNRAIARGATQTAWPDIWAAVTRHPATAKVLRERDVSEAKLYQEIQYITRFRDAAFATAPLTDQEIQDAMGELMVDLAGYTSYARQYGMDERKMAVDGLTQYIGQRIRYRAVYSGSETQKRKESIKHAAIQQVIRDAALPISTTFFNVDPSDPGAQDLLAMLSENILERFTSEPIELQDVLTTNAVEHLHELLEDRIVPSPAQLVDFVILNSPAFEDLLYRNGLRTNDPNREDGWKSDLPSRTLQSVYLKALEQAYEDNVTHLTNRHIVLALLALPANQVHLKKMGVANLETFVADFAKHSVSMDTKPNEGLSVHPIVNPESVKQAWDLDHVYKAEDRIGDVLLHFIDNDHDIRVAMKKSGLSMTNVKEWGKHYDIEIKKEVKADAFKVSDDTLEELFKTYCTDYTELAGKKKFDPMIGNEGLIDEVASKMLKRGKKNPILIGDPGIGKTKVIEGLSQAILRGDVPKDLIGARVLMLDLHQMDDSMWKGTFESRVLPILKGVAERNASGKQPPIILAIDEFAVAQNTGTHAGDPNGFRGLIKPYLTSGDLIMIATTTDAEYRQQVEKDAALARRMQPVYLKEPNEEETTQILTGLKRKYSTHHKLRIQDSLMSEIAKLAGRYIHTVNQPDKSIDLLDEACAVARGKGAATLAKAHIHEALAAKTNIPATFFARSDSRRYADLGKNLSKRVLDQDEAVKQVASALKRAKAGFKDPNTPIGNFLFVGPTGVGKTELSKALAEFLMGNEQESLVRFDMSEYADQHSVTRFLGAPPSLVGYDEGGALVKTLRSKPFAVYLYDEGEKAHPEVFNALLAPFSDGIVTDGRGVKGDMRNAINIITTNIGAREVMEEGQSLGLDPVKDHEAWQAMARPIYEAAVHEFFRPEFINRLDGIVYFTALGPQTIDRLVTRRFNQTASQLQENYGMKLEIAPAFMAAAALKGFDVRYGARPLKRAWNELVETPLSDWLLRQNPKKLRASNVVHMDVDDRHILIEGHPEVDTTILERHHASTMVPVFKLGRAA